MTMPQDREAIAKDATESHEKGHAEADEQIELAKQSEKEGQDQPEPGSPEERDLLVRRGELPMMGNAGALPGTNMTSNESRAERPTGGPLDFVTGAEGEPIPAAGNDPEMPGAVMQEGPAGLPGDLRQDERRKEEMDERERERREQDERRQDGPERSEGEQQMAESGTPAAAVADEDNQNTGQSPGVNDR